MDLELEVSHSKQELLDEDEREEGSSGKVASFDRIQAEMNGEVGDESPSGFSPSSEAERQVEDTAGEGRESLSLVDAIVSSPVRADEVVESPQSLVGSPPPGVDGQTPAKGFGLKKWRRVKRNLNKDAAAEIDSAIIHKRRLPIPEATKGRDERIISDHDGEAEESAASVDFRTIIPSISIIPSPPVALDLELRSLAERGFSVGAAEPENSEERSNKSSTAASAPRLRHEIGFGRERSRIKNVSGRGSGHVVHHKGQRSRGADVSRKPRGDKRSPISAFMGWGSVVSNGKILTKSVEDEEELSDDAHQSEEVQSGHCKENGEFEDISREDLGADSHKERNSNKTENNQPEAYLDPFLESIASLQAAQATLEDELQKLGEIGKYVDLDSGGEYRGANCLLEAQLVKLNQQNEHLEFKLDETLAAIKAKEAKVHKLEAILNSTELAKDLSFLKGKCKELEVEVENLFEKKMAAEIENLVMTKTTQSWKFVVEDHITLLEKQKVLADNQTNVLAKLRLAEERAIKLKSQADKLNTYCNELKKTQEVVNLKNRAYKCFLCCLAQMTILCIALVLFLLQNFSSSLDVVPT